MLLVTQEVAEGPQTSNRVKVPLPNRLPHTAVLYGSLIPTGDLLHHRGQVSSQAVEGGLVSSPSISNL